MSASDQPLIRVLLVDDEEELRGTLAKVLGRRGLSVDTAADGEEALRCLAQKPYQVVVLDLRMPGPDGLLTLRRIRQAHPRTRVIMLTGYGSAAAGLDAIRQQAFDFLQKPIAPERLLELIRAAALAYAGEAPG